MGHDAGDSQLSGVSSYGGIYEAYDGVLGVGVGFGANGEGYFRISITVPDHRLAEALERLERLKL